MSTLLSTTGYVSLFLIAIVSGTILPGPSDFTIIGMFSVGFNPWLVILVGSLGIQVGRVINYYIGTLGEDFVVQKKHWLKPKQVAWSKNLFHKYGTIVLLFTWVPFVDDPLTVVAGFFKYNFPLYLLYTTIAIFIRHGILYAIYTSFA